MADVGGIDTSIYKNVQTPNMLENMGNMANVANAVQQNKLLGVRTQREEVGLDADKIAVAHQKLDLMSNAAKSVLGLPNPTRADALTAMQRLVTMGALSPQEFAREAGNLPQDGPGILNWAAQHAMQLDAASAALTARYGTPGMVSTGDKTIPITQSAIRGTQPNGPAINMGVDPGTASAPVQTGVDPHTGAPLFGTRQTFAGKTGQPLPTGGFDTSMPGAMGAAARSGYVEPNGKPAPTHPGGAPGSTVRAPGPWKDANGRPVQGPGASPSGEIPMGVGPGRETALREDAGVSVQQGADLQRMSDLVPARKAALGQMESLLPQFTSGQGAGAMTALKSAAGRYGLDFNPTSTAASEEFKKLATQIALQQSQALSAGTDAGRGMASAANPGVDLSRMGNQQIIHMLKGNEDAIAVKNQAWQLYKSANGPQSYGQFATEFNQRFDPRVFQFPYMSPAERTTLVKGMSPAERQAFGQKLESATANGWVSPNGGQ